ncbi:MAG: peptidoglycan DD-metalloendopeptidase family protein [Clostridiales bacterium]|nr:peptidoglycan DD-metalloendopeptidase family protein [Clostridiales bacterium]
MKAHFGKRGIRALSVSLAALLTASLLVMTPAPGNYANAKNAQVQRYEDQISDLERTQKELQDKIAKVKDEAAQTADYKQNLDSLVYTLSQKISVSETLLGELETRIEETKTTIAEKETAIEGTFEKFQERMRMSYEEGSVSYLSVILGSDSVSDFLSRVDRINSMLEYDKTMLNQYKTEKEDLERERANLEESIALQKSTLEALEKDKATNERLSAQAASYYDSLKEDQASYQSQYEAAKAAEDKLDKELAAYLKSLQAQNSSQVTAAGEFMWPLPVGKGYISCYYGDSDPNGSPHYAVDVAISYGTPIYASNDGTVLKAESHSSYGYYVLIDHGNGRSTLYAHCSSLAAVAGQTVSKGQVIGYVGSTGFSTGNHLHFEFRVNGNRTNPLNYVQKGV